MILEITKLAAEINREHHFCQSVFQAGLQTSLEHAMRAGELLTQAKASKDITHGQWLLWVEANCEFGRESAAGYMRLYERREELANVQGLTHLGIETALAHLAKQSKKSKREKIIKNIKELAPLDGTHGKFPLILADPPWRYDYSISESRKIENQYPTMTLDDICTLPVQNVTGDDCVLFLWATSPKLQEAMEVIDAWGFTYKTCAVWDKGKIGMGYYFRQQHELLLVAAKGNLPVPLPEDRVSSVISAPRGKHSEKPVEVYEIIERMYPDLPKLELFSRKEREGWKAWGNQL